MLLYGTHVSIIYPYTVVFVYTYTCISTQHNDCVCFNVFSSVNILVAVVRAVVGSALGHRTQGGVEEKEPLTKHRDITSVETVVRTYVHVYIYSVCACITCTVELPR